MFLMGLNNWVFHYKLCGCGINLCCTYLNFTYLNFTNFTYFPVSSKEILDIQATTECRFTLKYVCVKTFLQLHTPHLNYFIYSSVKESCILHIGTIPVVHSKNWVKVISINLTRKKYPVFQVFYYGPIKKIILT